MRAVAWGALGQPPSLTSTNDVNHHMRAVGTLRYLSAFQSSNLIGWVRFIRAGLGLIWQICIYSGV